MSLQLAYGMNSFFCSITCCVCKQSSPSTHPKHSARYIAISNFELPTYISAAHLPKSSQSNGTGRVCHLLMRDLLLIGQF